jgi:molybdopterin-guanine dinucleotide biosynthesis protein
MRTIVIGGFSSGVGKTSLVCRLLEALEGWAALKTSPLRDGDAGPYEIVRDDLTLRSPGSDTARYLAAGASRVAWLRYRRDRLADAMPVTLSYFEGCAGLLVEGNSAARQLPGAGVIVVARAGSTETKPSVLGLLGRAGALVANHAGTGGGALPDALRGLRTVALDAESAGDPRTRAFVEEVATWARRPA